MLLEGRLILDCSALLPGPFLGKLLAQRGAKVLKIENPARPDGARAMGGGAYYRDLNEPKEVVNVEFNTDEFRTLVKKADGLIEGFRPQAKKKLGLDEDTLHALNPKLCIASLVGYPEDGPWRDRAGHNLNFEAVTGCLSLFAEMPALPLGDLFAAYEGALSLCAAMDGVARGDRGRRVVISMSESLKQVQSGLIREYQETGKLPIPGTNLFSGAYPCYRIYTDRAGRRIAAGPIEHKFWLKMLEILGLPELAAEGYATGEAGNQVVARIQAAFASREWKDWAPQFESADCCVEPELSYAEVFGRGL